MARFDGFGRGTREGRVFRRQLQLSSPRLNHHTKHAPPLAPRKNVPRNTALGIHKCETLSLSSL